MVSINVKIHHGFMKFLPKGMTGKRFDMSLSDGSTVEHLLTDEIGLPSDLPKLIFINGIHAMPPQSLKQDDRVSIFMPMTGG
ncbi:MAG: MoaD/ThiS family protein [Desulfobacterales bacterium]|nr:MoaD/ThiS family protein [Desulfobacterales bacterium]